MTKDGMLKLLAAPHIGWAEWVEGEVAGALQERYHHLF